MELTVPVTNAQNISFQVKVICEKMDHVKGKKRSPEMELQDKAAIINELKQAAALSSRIATYSAPQQGEIGQGMTLNSQPSDTRVNDPKESQKSLASSVASSGGDDLRQDFTDLGHKRLLMELSEAATLQRVTVKLQIDFDQFRALQRKLPDEYINKRLAVSVPVTGFDDDYDESRILQRVIKSRRIAKESPLYCQLTKKDKNSKRKCVVRAKVLDYDPKARRYLIEECSDEKERFCASRLCVQFVDFETSGDLDMRRMRDVTLQKQAFLRANIERMLFSEALKLRPELRPSASSINRIVKRVDLARLKKIKGEDIEPTLIRQAAE